ncbi:MAG: nuclease-related domain-containing protein, partial [Pseudomonadota bacterium]
AVEAPPAEDADAAAPSSAALPAAVEAAPGAAVPEAPPVDPGLLAVLAALCWLGGAAVLLWRPVQRYLRESALERVVRKSGFPAFRGVELPRKPGNDITLEHVLCTPSGLLVLVAPALSGVVTGGPALPSWSHGTKSERVPVPNPLLQVTAGVEAVRAVAGNVPVFGRVVTTGKVSFPLDPPPEVQTLQALRASMPEFAARATAERELGGAWRLLMRYPRRGDTLPSAPRGAGVFAWLAQHRAAVGGGVLLAAGCVLAGTAVAFAA